MEAREKERREQTRKVQPKEKEVWEGADLIVWPLNSEGSVATYQTNH